MLSDPALFYAIGHELSQHVNFIATIVLTRSRRLKSSPNMQWPELLLILKKLVVTPIKMGEYQISTLASSCDLLNFVV
ncbi:MAG: hypothetical protein CMK43_09050 [Porticoccaceae bacterium]|nr:hypothetical protein [Porticoccaceae bacterium]